MKLYLMRHGDAVFQAKTDPDRTLSETGRREVTSMVRYLVDENLTRIESSPYVRAQQTAAIIESELAIKGAKVPVGTLDYITPENDPHQVISRLQSSVKEGDVLLLVTHQPLVGALISLLVDGVATGMPLATATVACLDIPYLDVGQATVTWMRAP